MAPSFLVWTNNEIQKKKIYINFESCMKTVYIVIYMSIVWKTKDTFVNGN